MSASGNTWAFDLDQVEAELKQGGEATVQFNDPIGQDLSIVPSTGSGNPDTWPLMSSTDYLVRLNSMCSQWGARLTVRFFGHNSDVFDGHCLRDIPEIRSLSVDSIFEAENLEAIGELEHLSQLHLGVFELADKAILAKLPLEKLTHITLSPTQTKALDLAPLADANALQKLYLDGHYKNIAALAALHGLQEFVFNPKASLDLGFINSMVSLRALKLVLGGIQCLADIQLDSLQDIACTQVRGPSDMGDMQRFPALQRVFVQNQKQLDSVQFGAGNPSLEHLWFCNCPNLTEIAGLADCPQLHSLRWLFSDTDPATLSLPKSLAHLHLLSGKRKAEADEKAAIEAMGYIVDDHRDAWFFYK